jgi:hypothetical protein
LTVAGLSKPDRFTAEPTASPPVEHEVGACVGPQRKNETLPVGFGAVPTSAVPVMTARSVTDVPGPTLELETEFAPAIGVVTVLLEHVLNCPPAKSFNVAVVSCDERVSAWNRAKHGTELAPKSSALVRSTPPRGTGSYRAGLDPTLA